MSKAKVTLVNNWCDSVYICGDPNWDDQIFSVNDKHMPSIYEVKPKTEVEFSVGSGTSPVISHEDPDPNRLGVDFTEQSDGDGPGYYSVMGQNKENLFTLTDPNADDNIKYKISVSEQTFWTCTLTISAK